MFLQEFKFLIRFPIGKCSTFQITKLYHEPEVFIKELGLNRDCKLLMISFLDQSLVCNAKHCFVFFAC